MYDLALFVLMGVYHGHKVCDPKEDVFYTLAVFASAV